MKHWILAAKFSFDDISKNIHLLDAVDISSSSLLSDIFSDVPISSMTDIIVSNENLRRSKIVFSLKYAGDFLDCWLDKDGGSSFPYICFGPFSSKLSAKHCQKYLSTKFVAVLVSFAFMKRCNSSDLWKFIPFQDFNIKTDIDWTSSVTDISTVLFQIYGFPQSEISLLEQSFDSLDAKFLIIEGDFNDEI